MPSYDTSRPIASPPVSRSYQPTTTHMDSTLPLFSTNLTTSVPYQPGVFAFDTPAVNPYNLQQASYYSPNLSFVQGTEIHSLPTVRDARNAFTVDRNPMVKSESTSPIQSHPTFPHSSYTTECKRSSSEPSQGSGVTFATDVDTLMKAIQAKQPTGSQPQEHKVRKLPTVLTMKSLTHNHRSRMNPRPVRNRESGTRAQCQTVGRASTKRLTLRSMFVLIQVQSLL